MSNSSSQEHHLYIQTHVNPILESLVTAILLEKPDDPSEFMINWLQQQNTNALEQPRSGEADKLKSENEKLKSQLEEVQSKLASLSVGGSAPGVEEPVDDAAETEDESEDDDMVDDLPPMPEHYKKKGPRSSVSAEAYGEWNKKATTFQAPVNAKSEEQKERLNAVLKQSFLFSALDDKDLDTLVLAMKEAVVEAGTRVITEGDDGDLLYVVEQGEAQALKVIEGEERVVKSYEHGDAFGELALLYNTPRAASVDAKTACILWQLDRETFNFIVKDAASKKRELYSSFLAKVPILENMEAYERTKLADALKPEHFNSGDMIIRQGDPGERFCILEEGSAVATKSFVVGQQPQEVMTHGVGDYFGELALLRNEPRAANVVATSNVKVLSLDRRTFKRMLGSLEEILKRNQARYE